MKEGYYLPLNSSNKTLCKKCEIEGCKNCNINGICEQCKNDYEPLINNGKIIECNLICELGQENECSTCNLEKKINAEVAIQDIN